MKRLLQCCLLATVTSYNFAQKVGINNTNPQVSIDVSGALALRPETPIQVTASITTFNIANISYLRFSSNSNTASERLINLSPGKSGQHLIVEFSGAGAARMINGSWLSNGGKLLLNANLNFDNPAILGLVFDGTNWKEMYRTENLRSETAMDSAVFNTGGTFAFVVPPGVAALQVQLTGAGGWGGGSNSNPLGKGGNGGFVSGVLQVTEGETIDISVGGPTGQGVRASFTTIKRSATVLALAAGGGNGSENGGNGGNGGASGEDGTLGSSFYTLGGVGKGATPVAGGAGGAAGGGGSAEIGGNGIALLGGQNNSDKSGDGWGGNGWFGGGGAGTYSYLGSNGPHASGGGGGGSNYTGGLSGTIVSNGTGSSGGTGNQAGTAGTVKIKW